MCWIQSSWIKRIQPFSSAERKQWWDSSRSSLITWESNILMRGVNSALSLHDRLFYQLSKMMYFTSYMVIQSRFFRHIISSSKVHCAQFDIQCSSLLEKYRWSKQLRHTTQSRQESTKYMIKWPIRGMWYNVCTQDQAATQRETAPVEKHQKSRLAIYWDYGSILQVADGFW